MAFWNWLIGVNYLKPGICECGCNRSTHVNGKGKCCAEYPPDSEWPNGARCACQVYIRDEDNDGGDEPEVPSPSELERIFQLK